MKPKFTKFTHKTPHLGKKQHQLDPNLDLKQLVHHATVQYVDRDADGDVDIYDNPKKGIPDENPLVGDIQKTSQKLIAKQKGEIKHTRRGMAYEDLRKWFGTGEEGGVGGGGWDEYNTKGERTGKCARGEGDDGNGPKPKCLSKEKAAKMTKQEIAAAVKRKRREDPVADRPGKGGKPKMVSNKIEEEIGSVRYCPKCKKNETRSECAYGPKYWDMFSMPSSIMTNQSKYDIAQLHPTNEERDHEHSMARSQLSTVINAAKRLKKKMGKGEGNIEAWVQSKITKAADYLDAAADYLDSGEHDIEEGIESGPILPKEKGKRVFPKGQEPKATKAKLIKPSLTKKTNINAGYDPSEIEVEIITEKNKPTNPKLWAKWKSKAKAKFDVYPSAYANGWAAKGYKSEGGGWKSVSEEIEIEEAVRIPAKTGNLVQVMLTWRGKYYSLKMFFPQVSTPSRRDVQDQIEKVYPGSRLQTYHIAEYKPGEAIVHTEDWQKVNKQDKTDGMSPAAVKAYRNQYPKSKLKTAVTGDPKPRSKDAERRASYCRRSKGQQDMHNISCSKDPDKPICKARRRWKC